MEAALDQNKLVEAAILRRSCKIASGARPVCFARDACSSCVSSAYLDRRLKSKMLLFCCAVAHRELAAVIFLQLCLQRCMYRSAFQARRFIHLIITRTSGGFSCMMHTVSPAYYEFRERLWQCSMTDIVDHNSLPPAFIHDMLADALTIIMRCLSCQGLVKTHQTEQGPYASF